MIGLERPDLTERTSWRVSEGDDWATNRLAASSGYGTFETSHDVRFLSLVGVNRTLPSRSILLSHRGLDPGDLLKGDAFLPRQ
jgi:hypothetical protein